MEFHELFKETLNRDELEECSTLLYSVENIMLIGDSSWELSTVLCQYLAATDKPESIEFVRNASMYICQLFGNPKELLLPYLENAEAFFSTHSKYFLLVDILQTLLLRLVPRFVSYSLELSLNQLIKPINRMTTELAEKKTILTEQRLMVLTNKLVDFLQVFIAKDNEDRTFNLRSLLTVIIVNLFNEPFLSIDFSMDDNMNFNINDKECTLEERNSSYNLLKRIFNLLNQLGHHNFFQFAQELEFKCMYNDPTETLKVNKNSLCSFIFYAFTQDFNLPSPHSPQIYSDLFMLKSFLPIINFMLSQPNHEKSLDKGLQLLNYYLKNLESMTVESDLMELQAVVQTFQLLFRVSTYSTLEDLRKAGVEALKTFFYKFDRHGRYTILSYYLYDNTKDTTLNNYVSSYLIYLFKEEVANTLDLDEDFYKSANFTRIFRLTVKLKLGVKTDIIQESSRINAVLNMLRFLLLRDKANVTKVFDLLKNADFLEELKNGIQIGRGHYGQEKKNLLGMQKNDTSMKFEASMEGSGEKVEEPTTAERIRSCENALQSLDLIESLRCRVVELLEN